MLRLISLFLSISLAALYFVLENYPATCGWLFGSMITFEKALEELSVDYN